MLILTYSNNYGTVSFYGGGSHSFLLKKGYSGFSLVEKEHTTLTYAGIDGQETLSSRAMPRAITIPVDIVDKLARDKLRNAMRVLSKEGYLYITDGNFERRIYCNQVSIPEPESVLRGEIASFVVQFICDNPYFEDIEEHRTVIYGRAKNITTPFTLPRAFALTNKGATINNEGDKEVEPRLVINCFETLETSTYILIKLSHEGLTQSLRINDYLPENGDVVTVDVKNRTVVSQLNGDLINNLSDDSFLSKFILYPGENYITVTIKDITTDITVDCFYNNLYNEAVII